MCRGGFSGNEKEGAPGMPMAACSREHPLAAKGRAVSRFLFLNPPFICATYPPASGGPPSAAGIFGLAGPGTVPGPASLPSGVGSCPTFSPLQADPAEAGRFLRSFSVTASMRLLPSGISPAGCPFLSGLSSPDPRPAPCGSGPVPRRGGSSCPSSFRPRSYAKIFSAENRTQISEFGFFPLTL